MLNTVQRNCTVKTSYRKDRSFTDLVHFSEFVAQIYAKENLQLVNAEKPEDLAIIRQYLPDYDKESWDMQKVTDYVALGTNPSTSEPFLLLVQERWRKVGHLRWDPWDFTLRLLRLYSQLKGQKESEVHKLGKIAEEIPALSKKAGIPVYLVLLYGFADPDTYQVNRYIWVNLDVIAKLIAGGKIVPTEGITKPHFTDDGVLLLPVKKDTDVIGANAEEQTSFLVCDVPSINQIVKSHSARWIKPYGNWGIPDPYANEEELPF